MKPFFLLISLTLSVAVSHAKEFPGVFVNMEGDTIQCKFDVGVNIFSNDMVNQLTFRKKVKVILPNGQKVKYKPNEIRMFRIDSTSQGSEVYVPLRVEGKLWFVRLVFEGTISIYEYFFPHGYDYSVQMHYVLQHSYKPHDRIAPMFWRKKLLKYMDNDEWFVDALEDPALKYGGLPTLIYNYNLDN